MKNEKKIPKVLFQILALSVIVCLLFCNTAFAEDDCKVLQKRVEEAIAKSNYCESSRDCLIKAFGCPFNCFSLINKNSNVTEIEEMVRAYRGSGCPVCSYGCLALPELNDLICTNGKCAARGGRR